MKNISDKQDNGDLSAKLLLRRHFLQAYHEPANVFDACQGTRVLWSTLEKEFKLAGYMGVDLKKKKGRLRIDSVAVLSLPGWRWNVIDIDTYGVPWKQWLAMLPNVHGPLTVFLTIGRYGVNGCALSKQEQELLGVPEGRFLGGRYLGLFGKVLAETAMPMMLAYGNVGRLRIIEAKQAVSRSSNAQYIGLRIVPQPVVSEAVKSYNTGVDGVDAPPRPKHRRAKKEQAHV